jgi:type I restriction enzyme S subunit
MYSSDEEDVKLLRGDNIVQGRLRWDGVQRWPRSEVNGLSRYELEGGDIVLAMDRTWVKAGLKCARLQPEDLPCLLVQRVARVRGTDDLDTSYLYQTFQTHRFTQYVKGVQTETAIPHISSQQIREFPIHLPPPPEQQKIAAILSTWDRAIELAENLIAAKQKRKQALMQQLLTGKVRLPGFSDEWTEDKAGKFFKKRSEPGIADLPTLSVTMDQGMIRRDEIDRKMETTLESEQHLLVRKGDIAYNMMRMWQGASGLATEDGIVSPAYVVLKPTKHVDSLFASYLFKLRRTVKQFEDYSFGLTSDRLRLYYKDFAIIPLRFPSVPEQQRIAAILTTQDREIEVLGRMASRLAEQKKGLMQQLLTGKVRVNLDAETVKG